MSAAGQLMATPIALSLAEIIVAEVRRSGRTQKDIAAAAGITEKHLSGVVNGRVGGFAVADRVLAACGRRLVMGTVATGGTP